MSERENLISDFLYQSGWANGIRTHLAGDASFRKYDRLVLNDKSVILMNAAPEMENLESFVLMTEHLNSLGYSVPEIYFQNLQEGLILLEDLGDNTYTRMLETKTEQRKLYEIAVDLLIDLHKRQTFETIPSKIESYNQDMLLNEARLLTDWYLPQLMNGETYDAACKAYLSVWQQVLPHCFLSPTTLVHRDFHADNLMWLPHRDGILACGLIDYQDAVSGPSSYDLMSLVEDARQKLDPKLIKYLIKRYISAFPKLDAEGFNKSFTALAAQRHCKVIGIFTRLAVRDKKTLYLQHLPRVWTYLETASLNPILEPLRDWLETFIPKSNRENFRKN